MPRRPGARIVLRRQARDVHAHQIHGRAERLPQSPDRVDLEAGRFLFERRGVAASRLSGQVEEDVETVISVLPGIIEKLRGLR